MLSVEIRGINELRAKLGRLPNAIDLASFNAIQRATIETRNALFRGMSASSVSDPFFGRRSPAGHRLAARTGITRAALSPGRVWKAGETNWGAVGHPSAYVLALETGNNGQPVRPKSSTFLRVPLAAALTAGGQERHAGHSIRGVPGFFVWPTRKMREHGKGPKSIFIARSEGGRLVLWYILKREIKLPEKRLFEITTEEMRPRFNELLGANVARVVAEAN